MMTLRAEAAGPDVQAFLPAYPAAGGWRLGVVKELLGDLETATVAGMHFTMEKVVGLLRLEIGAREPELNDLERRLIGRALTELGREQGRLLPDANLFVVRTEMIADTLALI